MAEVIQENNVNPKVKLVAQIVLSKHFGKEIIDTIDLDQKPIVQYGENILKSRKAKNIVKKTITPLDETIKHIDFLISFVEFILNFNGTEEDNKHLINMIGDRLGSEVNSNSINELKKNNNTKLLIEIMTKLGEDEKYKGLHNVLDSVKNNLALTHGVNIDKYGEKPSVISFLKTIKEELIEYRDSVSNISIDGDRGAISKVEFAEWLKEQKKNGYIKLPYYENLLADITNKGRPGKIGQVVLKGHPGTGKTSIFSYKSEKEQRPHRIISMHQYINFYELIIQNTNLSPTKNQLEFFQEVISDYQSIPSNDLVKRLNELFTINKSNFPQSYTLIDFINTVFNINRFIKDKNQSGELLLTQDDINDNDKIQNHIITMLNYRKDEKIYKLLVSKKESIKGEILDAMEKGENVVLDEIDKVQEKEIEGLLAFLDLNTGKYHHIQGMEEKIYIPEWFSVYATSNDKFKPAGPLGRRFNSIELQYLDKENLACYIAARISNSDLTTPFSTSEIKQIVKAIEIIQKNQNEKKYNALDFSVRMIDTFINQFVSYRNKIVEKKHTNDLDSYIIKALTKAFESQTQDIYKGSTGDSISDQKESIISSINQSIKDKSSDSVTSITSGKRLNTSSEGEVNIHIQNFGYENPLLNMIVREKKGAVDKHEKRMLHYPEQMGELLQDYNVGLSKFSPIVESNFIGEVSVDTEIDKQNYSVSYNTKNKELIVVSHKDKPTPQTERFSCTKLYANSSKDVFISFGITGNKYISIVKNKESKVEDLGKVLHDMNNDYDNTAIDKLMFTTKDEMLWTTHHHDTTDTLYNTKSESLIVPNIQNMKLYDSGLFGVSHDKKNGMIVGLEESTPEHTTPFKKKIKPMQALLEFSLSDLGFEEYEIEQMTFDNTGEYLLVTIKKDDLKRILPIKV